MQDNMFGMLQRVHAMLRRATRQCRLQLSQGLHGQSGELAATHKATFASATARPLRQTPSGVYEFRQWMLNEALSQPRLLSSTTIWLGPQLKQAQVLL